MTIKELRYFIALADTGHFGRASERCEVSPSTLGMQVRRLEHSLGVNLFHRYRKPVTLTEIGERLVPLARLILTATEEIQRLAQHELSAHRKAICDARCPDSRQRR